MKGILQIPNVGKSIGEKYVELLQTGTFAELEALRAQIPRGVRELMSIAGLGPKKAMVLYGRYRCATGTDAASPPTAAPSRPASSRSPAPNPSGRGCASRSASCSGCAFARASVSVAASLDEARSLEGLGLLAIDGDRVRATERGEALLNQVTLRLVGEQAA